VPFSAVTGDSLGGVSVTDEQVREAVDAVCSFLGGLTQRDWTTRAGLLEWDCRRTAEHIASDLVAYAGQLTGQPSEGYVPFDITVDPNVSPADLVLVIQSTGGLLASAVATASPTASAWHPYGMGDSEAFAAMGIVESLVHTHDIAVGLAESWQQPPALCRAALERLFPERPQIDDAAQALLWCTGRTALPGRPRLQRWRWHNQRQRP
jgi:uncharacterized protein (TIGR03083 family)